MKNKIKQQKQDKENLLKQIDDIVYGLRPLFPEGYGLNRFSAIVWDKIKARLKINYDSSSSDIFPYGTSMDDVKKLNKRKKINKKC